MTTSPPPAVNQSVDWSVGVLQTSCSLSPLVRLRSFRLCSCFACVVSITTLFSFLFCLCRFYHYALSFLFLFSLYRFCHYTVSVSVPVFLVSFLSLHCFRFRSCFPCIVSVSTLFLFPFLFSLYRFCHYTVSVSVPVFLVSFLSLHCFRCQNASAVIASVFLFPLYYDTTVYKPCPSSCRHSLCVVALYLCII